MIGADRPDAGRRHPARRLAMETAAWYYAATAAGRDVLRMLLLCRLIRKHLGYRPPEDLRDPKGQLQRR